MKATIINPQSVSKVHCSSAQNPVLLNQSKGQLCALTSDSNGIVRKLLVFLVRRKCC